MASLEAVRKLSAEELLEVQRQIDAGLDRRRANRRPEALHLFQNALAMMPNNTWACVEVANELAFTGSQAEADQLLVQTINLLLEQKRNRADIIVLLMHRARLASEASAKEAADRLFREAIDFLPTSQRPYTAYSQQLRRSGRFDEATAIVSEGLERTVASGNIDELLEEYTICAGLKFAHGFKPCIPLSRGSAGVRNAAIVMLIKDEDDIIFENLLHHYGLGFRYFVVCDNNSEDNTQAEIQRFLLAASEAKMVILTDPVREYFQGKKTFALATVAASFFEREKEKIEWIFPLDADEFISLPVHLVDRGIAGLTELAEQANASLISYFLCNATSPTPLERLPPFGRCLETLNLISNFLPRPVTKVAYRLSPTAKPNMGNHFVTGVAKGASDILIAARHGVHLTHYPYRSLAHTRKKVINGGRAFEGVSNLHGGAHWRTHYALYRERGDQLLIDILNGYNAEVRSSLQSQSNISEEGTTQV